MMPLAVDAQASKECPQSGLSFIEQLTALSAGYCSKDNRAYISGAIEERRQILLLRPACKMWNCEPCAARNGKRWIARIINGVNHIGGEWRMFTLTAHEKWRKKSSVKNLRQGWSKLRKRMARHKYTGKKELFFVRVYEQHEDGSFHMHGLVNLKIGIRWLKDNARQCGLGYQAEIHTVDNAGQVAGYISKYMVKNADLARAGVEWEKGLRRVEVSRNFPKLPALQSEIDINWFLTQTRDGQLRYAQTYYIRGYEIKDFVREEI